MGYRWKRVHRLMRLLQQLREKSNDNYGCEVGWLLLMIRETPKKENLKETGLRNGRMPG